MSESDICRLTFLLQNKDKKRNWTRMIKRICIITFVMQRAILQFKRYKVFFKTRFNYDLLTPGFKESRSFTWLKQNSAIDMSQDQDNHTLFTKREC